LTAVYGALEEYLFEIKDTRIHPTLGLTPREYENMRIMETGQREHTMVKFDQNIMIMTCPRTTRRFHVIDPIRGVWVDGRHHWHVDFKNAKKGEKVEVRPEPWCANVAYVYYKNRWIAAIVRDLRPLYGRTCREAQLALRVERRKAKVNANKERLTKSSSKKMLVLWDPENFDERIGKQQREMEHLYSRLGMTVAIPQEHLSIKADVSSPAMLSIVETSTSTDDKLPDLPSPKVETVEESLDESFWG
jgi:putative transposase